MFSYLNNDFNEYSVITVNPACLFDNIGPFDPHTFTTELSTFPTHIKLFSQSVSSLDSGDDSDSNSSISEELNDFASHLEKDVASSIAPAFQRSWGSFCRVVKPKIPIAPEDSDQDADGESDDAGSDDEYVPPPDLDLQITTQSLKRRRSVSVSRRTETSTLPSDSTCSSQNKEKRVRVAPPSRNKQASQATSLIINRVVKDKLIESTNFICPECGWKQINKRIPDFKRHLKTHLRAKDDDHSSGYWCKGVRVEDARHYSIQPDATPYIFQDHERIGGCMRTFSRRDALKRHLDNANISCVHSNCT